MSKYTSKPVVINRPQAEIYSKISDLSLLQDRISELPQEAKDKVGNIKFSADSVSFEAPAVGTVVLNVTKRVEPSLIRLEAQALPVPLAMELNLEYAGDDTTNMTACIDVEIPMMLRPLVGGKLQEAADRFGDVFGLMFS